LRTGGDGFARYFDALVLSWEAMTAARPGGRVVRSDGYVASRAADLVLNNAVILRQDAIDAVRRFFDDSGGHAVWCHDDQAVIATALEAADYRRDTTTRPMLLQLADLADDALTDGSATVRVVRGVEPSVVANLNGLRSDFFADVPGLTAYASDDLQSGLVVIEVGRDVNISAVATRKESRRRGLASAVTRQVLTDSRNRGFVTASLQATPEAERVYARLNFQPVGRWQEWVPRGR
jgi:ribosomal protein S18 acetylase RimI-like enzyme